MLVRAKFNNVAQLILLNLIWSLNFPLIKIAEDDGASASGLTLIRFILGGIIILIIFSKEIHKFRFNLFKLFILGLLNSGLFVVLVFNALEYASSSLVSVLVYTNPFFVMLLSVIKLNYRVRILEVIGSILGITGIVLISNLSFSGEMLGYLLALSASFTWALGTVLYKLWNETEGKEEVFTALQVLIGGLPVGLIYLLIDPISLPLSPIDITSYLFTSLLSQGIGFIIWFRLLRGSPTYASIMIMSVPALAAVLSFFILGEKITLTQVVGIFTVLLGLLTINIRRKLR